MSVSIGGWGESCCFVLSPPPPPAGVCAPLPAGAEPRLVQGGILRQVSCDDGGQSRRGAPRVLLLPVISLCRRLRNSLSAAVPFGALAKCARSAVEIFFRRM